MSADTDTIRRAAALMRRRAQAVRAGANEPDMWFGPEEIVSEFMWGDQPQHGDVEADAEHIASWHPTVAIVMATHLEYIADQADAHAVGIAVVGTALAVARTYLGPER